MPKLALFTAAMLLAFNSVAEETCWQQAANRFDLPASLIRAVSSVESSHNPNAVAHPPNGTISIGMMQVNSWWLPKIKAFGVSKSDLYDPCTNVMVGSWILSQEVQRYGLTWRALGSYYAGPINKKNERWKRPHYLEYATKVIDRWRYLQQQNMEG